MLSDVIRVKTSRTFPSLCRANMETAIANLKTMTWVQTIDYHDKYQNCGGDPVTAEVTNAMGQ